MDMKHLIPIFVIFFFMSTTSASVALAPSSSDTQSFSFSKPQGDQTFSILSTDVDPKLQKICGETDYPIECLTTTIPFLDENVAIIPVSILKIETDAIHNKTKEAIDKAYEFSMNPSTSRLLPLCLKTCINNYNAILESKQRIFDAISIRDANELSMELSHNMEHVFACEDEFKEAKIKSPIAELNSLLVKIITNNKNVAINLVLVLKIEIDVTNSKTKEALDKASELSMNPLPQGLKNCINNYNAILESKQRIIDAILSGDTSQLSMELSYSVENIFVCEDVFKEVKIKSLITKLNSLFIKVKPFT
ncbi:Pectinesterase inhibitor [Gossypium australe]|uniref:Pectinesterase inhibitor n=1 Tax=Gossypium australe TaxID=47621 RepID=A0A5B6UEB5_9ROSI|nr:Pectinesterase inhibitor [Gossypium australe]